MATNEPGSAPQLAALTSLPRLEDIPQAAGGGYEPDRVREAFEAFRRHTLQLQAQLRVLQAVGSTANVEPSGHAVRMDALHLIRAAAEFADAVERDAQNAASTQISKTESEVRKRQHELAGREVEVDRYREETERQRNEITNAARAEIEQTLEWARAQATTIINRAQQGAEQLLTAAGLGPDALVTISAAILESARGTERPAVPSTPSVSA